ncbi:MAG TPA: DeoR/GlpR family DNA-binding transcription regulator [Anseongella sp.]
MLKEERHSFIIREINLHNKVLSSDLSSQLNVSEDTIRRDLKELDESGKVLKVHGGAISQSFHFPFNNKGEIYAKEAKGAIARKTLKLIKDGMVVLTGGGTTMIELARLVPDDVRATFFTISPLVALELVERPNLTVITVGGQLYKNAQVNMGASVINALNDIHVDLCLLGANGISMQDGITDSDWEVVQVKRAMIRCSKKLAVLCIAEKLNSVQRMKVCNLHQMSYLITELATDNPHLAPYRQQEFKLL